VTFMNLRGDLCEIVTDTMPYFVPFSSSVVGRHSPQHHIKPFYIWIIGYRHKFYVTITKNPKNHVYSDAGGVNMIFWDYKILNHSRGFW